ncbi:hypothetical protein SUGI_0581720 [Cryptomeria japonica]|nr:hypothetical protein SUGI_0581720 [Cryptomeria japonica]
MAKGLGRSFSTALDRNAIKGLKLHRNNPAIMHQKFVDDTLLMGVCTVKEASAFRQLLHSFEVSSSTFVNLQKSKIFFFNTSPLIQHNIARILGFQRSSLPSKYLGVPLSVDVLKKVTWEDLLAKIQSKLNSWTLRSLNLVGRLTLVKSILQAMPSFLFSAITAPKIVLKIVRNLQRNFLWRGSETKRKWALVGWDKICLPRWVGGLGLRDPEILSNALGAKLWWRWLNSPFASWAVLWKAKYASN